ncbi:MAG TPA: ATP-binding protein [Methanoregulaceae archaeon]|nr:ATP-binding protein [Methanoregulaceae archaeon]
MAGNSDTLKILDVLLSAEIFNQNLNLDINDLTPDHRVMFGLGSPSGIKRPVTVSESTIRRVLHIDDPRAKVAHNPVVIYEEFGQRFRIPALEAAANWFIKNGGLPDIKKNPALAYYFENFDASGVSYSSVRAANPPFEDSKAYLEGKISEILAADERLRAAMDLVIINAPEEIDQQMTDLVCSPEQLDTIRKMDIAIKHRDFLLKHRIHEVGKLLFVGPPGTGKTSLALAMSHAMHTPIIEVRLSMVTSQYLGETSKNIDKIFEFAKKLAPCILFIDEFDYVAKSRVTDDHGAMKRAVNSLLKNIDKINLVKFGVLLIGATNHPQLLDEAAWRRFDEVVEFSLPNEEMREEILKKVTASVGCECDFRYLAAQTDGLSGSDIRMVVKEATLTAIIGDRRTLSQSDIEKGIEIIRGRGTIRRLNWL